MKLALAALFFITAALYASVGFGGGSTYTALLIVFETDYRLIPIISLACNVLVVSANSVRYGRADLIRWQRLWPFLALSIPLSWLGGRIPISETVFIGLLWIALLLAGLRLLFFKSKMTAPEPLKQFPVLAGLGIGAGIGFYAGLVGIGGGIFLAPVLYAINWGRSREIAAACSVFILLNSLSGLIGHAGKLSDMALLGDAISYWPLLPAVFIGGFIGNYMGVFRISELWLKRLTGILILSVALRLAIKWISLL